MKKPDNEVKKLCTICLKRKVGELKMCVICRNMDQVIFKLIQDRPKQAKEYLAKQLKKAEKSVRNRYVATKVEE